MRLQSFYPVVMAEDVAASARFYTEHKSFEPTFESAWYVNQERGKTMDLQDCKQRREEMIREAEQNRLSKALRESRKRRGAGRESSPAWELKRIAGRLLKLSRALRRVS